MNQAIAMPLDECFKSYFEPLIQSLSLTDLRRDVQGMGGLYEAHGQNSAVRLVNDRGYINFDVYCLSQPKQCCCDVELLSEFLEPPKSEEKGIRRLDLESQARILRDHWTAIELLMAPETAKDTGKKLNRLGTVRSKKIFK